jgi:signal transduction histidine kinase
LQLAQRTQDAAAIESAQQAVHSTLADLRGLVGAMRKDTVVDLRAALRALCAGIREPEITLELPSHIAVHDEARAHALFRLVQEAITNAIKHGKAHHVRVSVDVVDGVIHACVRDDGVGGATTTFGNGLLGLRERLGEVGGDLEVTSPAHGGFEIHGWVPL